MRVSRRYSYICQVCGEAYETNYQPPGRRRCAPHGAEFAARVSRLQADPEYVARLKQLQSEFLARGV